VIDIEHSVSITSQKAEKGPRKLRAAVKQVAAPEQRKTKTKETIVETSTRKGQQWIKAIPRATGIKNYENCARVKEDQKACC